VRRRGLDDALVATTVNTPEPVVSTPAPTHPWQNPVPAWPPDAPITGLLISSGIAVAIWRHLTRSRPATPQ
jgi:hypothetical protein